MNPAFFSSQFLKPPAFVYLFMFKHIHYCYLLFIHGLGRHAGIIFSFFVLFTKEGI